MAAAAAWAGGMSLALGVATRAGGCGQTCFVAVVCGCIRRVGAGRCLFCFFERLGEFFVVEAVPVKVENDVEDLGGGLVQVLAVKLRL